MGPLSGKTGHRNNSVQPHQTSKKQLTNFPVGAAVRVSQDTAAEMRTLSDLSTNKTMTPNTAKSQSKFVNQSGQTQHYGAIIGSSDRYEQFGSVQSTKALFQTQKNARAAQPRRSLHNAAASVHTHFGIKGLRQSQKVPQPKESSNVPRAEDIAKLFGSQDNFIMLKTLLNQAVPSAGEVK